jgi:dolichyl-phosphate beta-glucosyltransferase
MNEHSLSVVIPTYNETHRLPQTLREIYPYLQRRCREFEVVVVDDRSPDGTAALVEAMAAEFPGLRVLVQPGRLGKGAAVRRGCLAARCDYVLFMDADHATPIEELDDMTPALDKLGSGAVVGVRTYQEDERRWRRIVGLAAQLLAHLIVFRKAVCDSQCGFKLFTRDVVQRIFPYCRVDGGMIDVELFSLMHAMNVPCRYQAVHWTNKEGSRIRVLRCMMFDPLDMLTIRLRHAWGAYRRPVARQPWE